MRNILMFCTCFVMQYDAVWCGTMMCDVMCDVMFDVCSVMCDVICIMCNAEMCNGICVC